MAAGLTESTAYAAMGHQGLGTAAAFGDAPLVPGNWLC